MKNNKIATYLLYAVGEIILVVVGILIAVSIDNWNESQKIKNSVSEHIEILRQNLIEDRSQLQSLKTTMQEGKSNADSLLLQIMTLAPIDENTTKYLIKLLLEHQFRPNKNALETLVQAGEIPYLSPQLQKYLLDYYALIESTQEREQISNTQIQSKYEAYINENYSEIFQKSNRWAYLKNIYKHDPREPTSFDELKFISDKRLEALVISRSYQTNELKEFYSQLYAASTSLLDHVDKELNKN